MIGESVQGLLRHGVHDERGNELVNVDAIGIGRVLSAGGGPQRTLLLGALGFESSPTRIVGELVLEQLVSEASVGDSGLASRALASSEPISSSLLSTAVSTRDTKKEATEPMCFRSWPLASA